MLFSPYWSDFIKTPWEVSGPNKLDCSWTISAGSEDNRIGYLVLLVVYTIEENNDILCKPTKAKYLNV